ncbi:MAG: hypothetical protein K2J64_01415 [Desulfovibrio sp.]|nr:hypothetical protein [Desulfovibrio sp.]
MRRPLRLLFRAVLVALLGLSLLMGAAWWFLQRDPGGLINRYLGEAALSHGLDFSMGAVDVSLWPSPAVAVSNVRVERADITLSAAYLTVRPDLFALLRGTFSPWSVALVRPRLEARLDSTLGEPGELAGRLRAFLGGGDGKAPAAPLGFLDGSCRLEITQGDARLTGADGAALSLRGLQCRLKLAPPGEAEGALQFASLRYFAQDETVASLERFRLEGESDLAAPLSATPGLKLGATLHAAAWPGPVRATLAFKGQPGGWNGSFALDSDLLLGSAANEIIPLTIHGTAAMATGARDMDLRGVNFALGADSGRLDGTLRLPGSAGGPALKGSLLLHRASLTQWLGFARNLAPGLQLALDNVTEASVDFELDGEGLKAPRISAVCAGARFTGSGGVPSWQTPEVVLDLASQNVNLGLALPEAVASPPENVHFFHAPLTPMPGEPLKPGETGIDYDIRLAAETVRYGPLTITDAKTRIYPGKLDKNGLEDVLIEAEAALYGGSFRGQCILGGSRATPYAITAQVRGVNGAPLAKDMPVLPFRSGRFRADANVQSQGRELDLFLSKLRGSLSVRGEQGALAGVAAGALAFSRLEADIALRSGVWRAKRLGLDGAWKLRLENAGLDGNAELDGRLWFGATEAGAGMEFQKIPASGSLRLGPELCGLDQGLRATWRAALGCQSARKRLTAAGLHLEALGGTVTGELNFEGAGPSVQGRIDAKCPDLARTLRLMGMGSPRLPQALRSLSFTGELTAKPETLGLAKLNARTPQLAATGSLSLSRRKGRPLVEFALASEAVDLEKLAGPDRPAAKAATKAPARGAPWEFPILRDFDAKGELKVRDLSGWRFHLKDLVMPVALEAGRLTLGPGNGRFYGATLHSRSTVDFRKAMAFDTGLAVTAFDLGAAARDRKVEAVLTGQASLEAALRAKDLGPGRLPAALNGDWSFSVRNGSYQSRGKGGELKGEPTRFTIASASGTVRDGVAQSRDLRIQGPTLTTTGSGSLNLVSRTLDCNFTVNMKGLPEIPLRVYGSVDKPKTSIGAGKLILNTITGITTGFVDILGGIVEGTWKLFR